MTGERQNACQTQMCVFFFEKQTNDRVFSWKWEVCRTLGTCHLWILQQCPAFGWNRVNFLQSSSCGAMFWICDEHSVDNPWMVWLFLSSAHTHKVSSVFHTVWSARRLGVHKKFGGDTTFAGDPKLPKGYSIPHGIVLSNNSSLGAEG